MKHFVNLKDIPAKDLRKIITDAKKRKSLRKKLSTSVNVAQTPSTAAKSVDTAEIIPPELLSSK